MPRPIMNTSAGWQQVLIGRPGRVSDLINQTKNSPANKSGNFNS
ncbi:MAG TPA: hypothetical protein PKD32_07065 [Saprospiraceae bacterium]|nr:hypothetical protein [Saprospiraceae bacterium]